MVRLFTFLKPHKALLSQLIIINLLLSTMLILAPLVIKAIVDQVIGQQQLQKLLPYLSLLLIITGIRATLTYFYTYGQNKLGQLVMTGVRTALYRKLLALSFSFYDKEQTGQLMNRVSSDVESTRIFLSQILIESMSHILTICLAALAFLQQDSYLTLIAIIPVLLSGVAMYYARRALSEPWTSQHDRMAQMSATLQDNLAGIKVVKAFAQEEQAQGRFREVQVAVRHGSLNITDLWSKRWVIIGSIPRFMQLGLLLIGGQRVMSGQISLGTLVAVLSLSLLLLGAINALGTQLNSVSQTATAAVRIFELLDEPLTIQSPTPSPDPIAAQFLPIPRRAEEWQGQIDYKDVSFIYPTANARALIDINLHIPVGSSLAIVGATGSGKSTLIHLIGRFYDPTSGHIEVDGRDVRSLDLSQLRSQIGLVAQDTLLFNATIAENIAFGRPGASQAEIERVAKLAQAHDFITHMPEGYQTRIGERGTGLSGGQRQRVAIARAMLLDPKILILDDSMSALDAETERLLQAAITTVMQGRTTILVAHRLTTAQHADHIIVLRDGQIIEQGAHAELDAAGGHYHQVLALQQMNAREMMGGI